MSLKVSKSTSGKTGEYRCGDVDIQLPAYDTDVTLTMPNGEHIVLQWRVEGPSIDICLEKDTDVINWSGTEMTPAKAAEGKNQDHVRIADQLCIPLAPSVLYPGEVPTDANSFIEAIHDGRYDKDSELFTYEVMEIYGGGKDGMATREALEALIKADHALDRKGYKFVNPEFAHAALEGVLQDFIGLGLGRSEIVGPDKQP